MTQIDFEKIIKNKHAKSVSIDKEAEAVYFSFSDEPISKTERINDSLFVDLDENDELVGVEMIRVVSIKKVFAKAMHDISACLPKNLAVA